MLNITATGSGRPQEAFEAALMSQRTCFTCCQVACPAKEPGDSSVKILVLSAQAMRCRWYRQS